MLLETPISERNMTALHSLGTIAPRGLGRAQENHPDHRVFSNEGMPFPRPANGVMKAYEDIDFRNTKPNELPEGMMPKKKRRPPEGGHSWAPEKLGRSKWDFQYMESGMSLAVRIGFSIYNEQYPSEFLRIRQIGMTMCRYQKARGYIDPGFTLQTSEEMISIGKLPNGDDILAPHIVFWRIDGTRLDPEYQGN